jgi:glutathionyl-hydroquinone reductase
VIKLSPATRLAGPVDTAAHGDHVPHRDPRPRFTARLSDDGPYTARPFRYHVYGAWSCPWSQRVAITRSLAGLEDIVTMSYLDDERDGRGWAFRSRRGPDPVNGFTLLREAYTATDEDYDGPVTVPALWDRATASVISTDSHGIGVDLATRFRHLAEPLVDTYPAELAGRIEELDRWIGPAVNRFAGQGTRLLSRGGGARLPGPPQDARLPGRDQSVRLPGRDQDARLPGRGGGVRLPGRDQDVRLPGRVRGVRLPGRVTGVLLEAFEQLDARLSRSRYLLGDAITEADVRLWVSLVRYDAGPNARRTINPGLHVYPHLWAYARDLYTVPAFRDTTDFAAFTRPGARLPDWDQPAG